MQTPPRVNNPVVPNAPRRDNREFQERFQDYVLINNLTLDFSNIQITIPESQISSPPAVIRRPNKKIRVEAK